MDASSKKVGADGLTKKERRALRLEAQNKEKHITIEVNHVPKNVVNNKKECPKQTSEKEGNNVINIKANISNNLEQKDKKKIENNVQKQISSTDINVDNKVSKSQLRAARRVLQEKQREAKAATQNENIKPAIKKPTKLIGKPTKLRTTKTSAKPVKKNQIQIFDHLYLKHENLDVIIKNVHPAFVRLGAQYSSKTILGSNSRCLALLSALHSLVNDYKAPSNQEFCRSLETHLQVCVDYLQKCRPLAVSMTNALKHFKFNLTQIDTNLLDNQKKVKLIDVIEIYIQDEIKKAGEAISLKVQTKITNEDIILTYGCSSLIKKIFLDAHKEGKKFEVIIVDSRPLHEGKEKLRRLINVGIKCTFVCINSYHFAMKRASKIIIGAHALLANGCVMSRAGTAQVALLAQAFNKPVLVCCETYKFSERVQTDPFVYNEIGDPSQLFVTENLDDTISVKNCKGNAYVTPLNLLYDITPPELVTAVVTELGFLPCTSVPVVLRIKPNELN